MGEEFLLDLVAHLVANDFWDVGDGGFFLWAWFGREGWGFGFGVPGDFGCVGFRLLDHLGRFGLGKDAFLHEAVDEIDRGITGRGGWCHILAFGEIGRERQVDGRVGGRRLIAGIGGCAFDGCLLIG